MARGPGRSTRETCAIIPLSAFEKLKPKGFIPALQRKKAQNLCLLYDSTGFCAWWWAGKEVGMGGGGLVEWWRRGNTSCTSVKRLVTKAHDYEILKRKVLFTIHLHKSAAFPALPGMLIPSTLTKPTSQPVAYILGFLKIHPKTVCFSLHECLLAQLPTSTLNDVLSMKKGTLNGIHWVTGVEKLSTLWLHTVYSMRCWRQNCLWEWYNQGNWDLIHFRLVHRLVGPTWMILNFVLCSSVFRRNAADWHYEATRVDLEMLPFPQLAAWVICL